MDAREELRAAVDGLYSAFRPYRLRDHIAGCPCCVSDEDSRKIQSVPLAELTSEQLRRYTGKAMTTWGTAHEFRHFLPRIAELMSFDQDYSLELEIVAGKLTYADWDEWPVMEKSAVHRFLEALWRAALHEFPCPPQWQSIDVVLCAIGRAEEDLEPYLATWLRTDEWPAKLHLADFLIDNYASLTKSNRLAGAFWEDREHQRQQVETWIRTSNVRETLSSAAASISNESAAHSFPQALALLEML